MSIIKLSKVNEAVESYKKHKQECPQSKMFTPSFLEAAHKYNLLNDAEKQEFKLLVIARG